MSVPDNSNTFAQLRAALAGHEEYLSAVEVHGLLCAMAILPVIPEDWQTIAGGEDGEVADELAALMSRERARLASRLGAGDHIQLPCRLDPYEENEGEDLTAWCTGFIAGISAGAPEEDPSEETQRLLLPFLLISGLDEDPELDALWQDEKLVREMARNIPDLLEELFLNMQAPELKD